MGKVIRMSSFLESDVRGTGWRKSRYSMNGGNCVEVGSAADTVVVRDSVKPDSLVLNYAMQAWRTFVAEAKAGEFDTSH